MEEWTIVGIGPEATQKMADPDCEICHRVIQLDRWGMPADAAEIAMMCEHWDDYYDEEEE